MRRGDKFNKHGYELVASIDVADGSRFDKGARVLVMHNHSSHYLIAISDRSNQIAADCCSDDSANLDGEEVIFEAALPYYQWDDEEALNSVYRAALNIAVVTAMRL